MLNLISMATAAVPAAPMLAGQVLVDAVPSGALPSRVRPGAGTWLRCGGSAVLRDHAAQEQAVAAPSLMAAGLSLIDRPQASDEAVLFETGTQAADQAEFAIQQRNSKKYAHLTTRIAPAPRGALGPHPARDPV